MSFLFSDWNNCSNLLANILLVGQHILYSPSCALDLQGLLITPHELVPLNHIYLIAPPLSPGDHHLPSVLTYYGTAVKWDKLVLGEFAWAWRRAPNEKSEGPLISLLRVTETSDTTSPFDTLLLVSVMLFSFAFPLALMPHSVSAVYTSSLVYKRCSCSCPWSSFLYPSSCSQLSRCLSPGHPKWCQDTRSSSFPAHHPPVENSPLRHPKCYLRTHVLSLSTTPHSKVVSSFESTMYFQEICLNSSYGPRSYILRSHLLTRYHYPNFAVETGPAWGPATCPGSRDMTSMWWAWKSACRAAIQLSLCLLGAPVWGHLLLWLFL